MIFQKPERDSKYANINIDIGGAGGGNFFYRPRYYGRALVYAIKSLYDTPWGKTTSKSPHEPTDDSCVTGWVGASVIC